MARSRRHPPLRVFLNGRDVGLLRKEPSGAIDFQYAATWLEWRHALPVSLSLPLREDRYVGAPVAAVFDNLLPDNDAIRTRVAERVGAEGIDAYSLLAAVGRDCVGALQFLPEGFDPSPVGGIEAKPIGEDDVAAIVADLAKAPLGMDEDDDFRISIAGAQEKTALLRLNGQWCKPLRATATTHILKPQIGTLPNGIDLSNSVENEYLCLKIIKALGLPSAEVEMHTFGSRRVLIVERFDRLHTDDGRLLRLPQEDCCQALSIPPTRKYEKDGGPGLNSILRLLGGGDEGLADQLKFLKAIVVFWLLGATDGHGKNFSIFLAPGARYRMTPLYDVLTAQPSVDAGQIRRNRMRLAMAVGRSRHYQIDDIVPRHFIETAEAASVGTKLMSRVFDELRAGGIAALESTLAQLPGGFPEVLAKSVEAGFRRRIAQLDDL